MDTLKHLCGVNLNPYVQLTFQKGKTNANKSAVDFHKYIHSHNLYQIWPLTIYSIVVSL